MGVEQWNTSAIGLSLVLAIALPFEIFLLAYAILGPLHYLTELQWIRSRGYCVRSRVWPWASGVLALVLGLPLLFASGGLDIIPDTSGLHSSLLHLHSSSNSALLMIGIWAITLVLRLPWYGQVGAVLGGLFFALWGADGWVLSVGVGVLLPTLIHVFGFTLLFMVAGARRRSDPLAWLNIGLLAGATGLIWTFPFSSGVPQVSSSAMEIYASNGFHSLHSALLSATRNEDLQVFSFGDETLFRLQIFIAFAYVHHYLNWFIKTDLIGWHRDLQLRHWVGLVGVWAACMTLFAVDYRLGALGILSLSFLHVILEFPLNVQSVRTLFKPKPAPSSR